LRMHLRRQLRAGLRLRPHFLALLHLRLRTWFRPLIGVRLRPCLRNRCRARVDLWLYSRNRLNWTRLR